MSKPKRLCPTCNECGAKKFTVLSKKKGVLVLKCNRCFTRINLAD